MAANSEVEGVIRPKEPHFFKVVLFPFDQGLRIPDEFMRKYGRDLKESHVTLKVPTGESWKVELNHYGNGTRLEKGWKEFAEYYFIKQLFFLVFKYEGNSQFHVLIFDPSTLEIDYPIETNKSGSEEEEDEGEEETFVQNLESDRTNRASKRERNDLSESESKLRQRPRTRSSYYRLNKENSPSEMRNFDEFDSDSDENTSRNSNSNSDFSEPKMKNKVGRPKGTKRKRNLPPPLPMVIPNNASEIHKEKSEAYRKAKSFRSSHPSFIYFIQPSTISGQFAVNIPANFEKEYLKKMKDSEFTIQVWGKGRKWPVILRVVSKGRVLGQGWKKFSWDNRLKVGDVCIFELVKSTRNFYYHPISSSSIT